MKRAIRNLILPALIWVPGLCQADQPVQEYELKTAFIYNFVLFTQWPAAQESGAYINVCTFGDQFGPVLEQLQGRKIRDKRIFLRRDVSLEQMRECHLLYIGANEPEILARIREQLRDSSVLTVSDLNPASSERTIINMIIDNKRLVFDVDMMSVRQARLVMSSKLLRLARRVY